jgi:ABC-type multidrug transport system fused ATPase/permease subunit
MRPDSGEILVDGQSLSEVALQSYYAHIGYLTQEPSVFDGTIRENLMYGLQDKKMTDGEIDNDKHIQAAIRMAHCDFVYDLPHGLDTEIGEKGIRLS